MGAVLSFPRWSIVTFAPHRLPAVKHALSNGNWASLGAAVAIVVFFLVAAVIAVFLLIGLFTLVLQWITDVRGNWFSFLG